MKTKTTALVRDLQSTVSGIVYEVSEGIHTYSPCPCDRRPTRSGKCAICLLESLRDMTAALFKELNPKKGNP